MLQWTWVSRVKNFLSGAEVLQKKEKGKKRERKGKESQPSVEGKETRHSLSHDPARYRAEGFMGVVLLSPVQLSELPLQTHKLDMNCGKDLLVAGHLGETSGSWPVTASQK